MGIPLPYLAVVLTKRLVRLTAFLQLGAPLKHSLMYRVIVEATGGGINFIVRIFMAVDD